MGILTRIFSWLSPVAGVYACGFILLALVYSPQLAGNRVRSLDAAVAEIPLEVHQEILATILSLVSTFVSAHLPRATTHGNELVGAPKRLPPELIQEIISTLEDCPDTLQQLSLTSMALNAPARLLEFHRIELRSVGRLVQLASLIQSPDRTIPKKIGHLSLEFKIPQFPTRTAFPSRIIRNALADVFEYFEVEHSLTLNLPWTISRLIDWSYIEQYATLRSLSLHGTYPHLLDIAIVISRLSALKVLTITASVAQDAPGQALLNDLLPQHSSVSSELREIVLSPASLQLMDWMRLLQHGLEQLHMVRIRVDHVGNHIHYFRCIDLFLQRFGRTIAHLWIWFDETWHLTRLDEGESVLVAFFYRTHERSSSLQCYATAYAMRPIYGRWNSCCRPCMSMMTH